MKLELQSLRRADVLCATALGVGFIKPAPGTWGSLAALLVWWFWLAELPALLQLGICGAYFVLGWLASSSIARAFATDDAGEIVADEVVGMWLALALLPRLWWLAALAFVLFRLFDIAKPGPVGWLDRNVKGGLGVMLDDVAAGGLTAIVLYFSIWLLQLAGIVQLGV